MKNATRKVETSNLGTKRACPHCATKFYDFNKDEIACPKCKAMLDVAALSQPVKPLPEKKVKEKTPPEEALMQSEESSTEEIPIESVDELGDDDDDVVEEIEVDDEEEGF